MVLVTLLVVRIHPHIGEGSLRLPTCTSISKLLEDIDRGANCYIRIRVIKPNDKKIPTSKD